MVPGIDEQNLEAEFERLRVGDKRLAGEVAYVLAVKSHEAGDRRKTIYYARECIRIFNELDIQTLEDAAARLNVVAGVCLPELIHARVVLDRFHLKGIPY